LCFKKISIPSGAIKRWIQKDMELAFYEISIPSGAIKRGKKMTERILNILFQFLLVRLKAVVIFYTLFISSLFQFLLVRLKEYTSKYQIQNDYSFQFLLVRLKVLWLPTLQVRFKNFNSFWCD